MVEFLSVIKRTVGSLALLIMIIILSSCEGPQGPPGLDPGDIIDPVVHIDQPLPGEVINSDEFLFSATVTDNDEIEIVQFFINESNLLIYTSTVGEDSLVYAEADEAPYEFTWSFSKGGLLDEGKPYPIYAEAKDISGNIGRSAVRFIYFEPGSSVQLARQTEKSLEDFCR